DTPAKGVRHGGGMGRLQPAVLLGLSPKPAFPCQLEHALTAASDQVEKLRALLTPEPRDDRRGIGLREVRDDEACVAPAGAPADLMRFQKQHLDAAARQVECRAQAGEAAADDGNLYLCLAVQTAKDRLCPRRGTP